MLKKAFVLLFGLCLSLVIGASSPAALISVTGGLSAIGGVPDLGALPQIIGAPADVLDDDVVNTSMQGFNEAQGVTTTAAYTVDGGVIPAGTVVDSHMIFLNSDGETWISHASVEWTFDGRILGVMSDSWGQWEAASTDELGAPGTNYPVSNSGKIFRARGLETFVTDKNIDDYSVIGPDSSTLRVSMAVTEPGDWIRVVTAPASAPEPASLFAFGGLFGIGGIGYLWRRKRSRG